MIEVKSVSSVEQTNHNVSSTKTSSSNKTSFQSYLGESSSLDDIFERAAENYNVPVNLLKAIGKAESNFKTDAVSHCGAQGVMQLMPATAKSLGVTDSFDPEQNIMGGAKLISSLLDKYDGDVKLSLAAYNAGSGNVAKYGGIPPFKETQNYVKKVTGYMDQGDITVSTGNKSTESVQIANQSDSTKETTAAVSEDAEVVDSLESNGLQENLDRVFSYSDYLEFLDKFLGDEEEKESEEDNNSNYFASKQINYNVAVMNLLKNI